jgi:peptidyl-prolyl cis-trans isomerase B (cyclophilin B)
MIHNFICPEQCYNPQSPTTELFQFVALQTTKIPHLAKKELSMTAKQWKNPPAMQIDTEKNYRVDMETNRGTIVLELYPQYAPKTVNNFVFLASEGFYDDVTFHRVIPDFMIQGGDPTGSGRGGPGYRFEDEFAGNPLKHETGVISMANAGPNTNGSQFFITHSPQPHLNGAHTVFGKVVEGQDVVDAIRGGDVMTSVTAEAIE